MVLCASFAEAEARHEVLEHKVSAIVKEVNALKTELEATVKKEIEEVKTVSLAEIMKEEMEKSFGNMNTEIQSVKCDLNKTRAEAEEQRDKESRRNNVILYNVPESKAARAEDRNKDDVTACLRLCNKGIQVGISEEDLVQVFRLGKVESNETDTARPRPLMVQFAGYTQKNLVMESLYKLKHAETQFKKIVIAHDMTQTEREECRKLVADAKAQEAKDNSGEYIYRVRGLPGKMKVVKIKMRQQLTAS